MQKSSTKQHTKSNNTLRVLYGMIKLDSSQGHKDSSTNTNQCDIPHQQRKGQKSCDNLNRWRKAHDKIHCSFLNIVLIQMRLLH